MELRSRCWQCLELTTNLPINLDRTMTGQGPRPSAITTYFFRMRSEGFLLLSGGPAASERPRAFAVCSRWCFCFELQAGVFLAHVTSRHALSCHVMSCHVTSRHVTSRHVTSRHVASRHVTSRHVTSRHLTSPHLTSGRPVMSPLLSCHVALASLTRVVDKSFCHSRRQELLTFLRSAFGFVGSFLSLGGG